MATKKKEYTKRTIYIPEGLLDKTDVSARQNAMFDGAEAAGLDVYYAPEPYADEKTLTKEEWQEMRKMGIGGSDAGIILGVSKWRTLAELAMDKEGFAPKEDISAARQFIFDSGHAMEPVVANLFAAVSGFDVHADERMFRHPLYPFMCANCDFFATDLDGMEVGVEIKCTNKDNIWAWGTGVYGSTARVGNMSYIVQCQHYMAVMNLDRWYLVVGVANSPDDLKIVRVDRDYDFEKSLIEQERYFWETYVVNGAIPTETSLSATSYDARLHEISEKKGAPTTETVEMGSECLAQVTELMAIADEKARLNSVIKELDERANLLRLPVIEALGSSVSGTIADPMDKDYQYEVNYKAPSDRTKFNEDLLALECPEVLVFLKDNGYLERTEQKPRFTLSHKRKYTPKKRR